MFPRGQMLYPDLSVSALTQREAVCLINDGNIKVLPYCPSWYLRRRLLCGISHTTIEQPGSFKKAEGHGQTHRISRVTPEPLSFPVYCGH